MNKTWNSLYSLPTKKTVQNSEPRIKPGGSGYEKVKAELEANNLYLLDCYNKWYSVGDNRTGHSVPNNNNGVFDTLKDVKDWIKNDMVDYLNSTH